MNGDDSLVVRWVDHEMGRRLLTQAEMAALLEVSPQYLSDVMRGRRNVSLDLAIRLQDRLGVSARAILGDQIERLLLARGCKPLPRGEETKP